MNSLNQASLQSANFEHIHLLFHFKLEIPLVEVNAYKNEIFSPMIVPRNHMLLDLILLQIIAFFIDFTQLFCTIYVERNLFFFLLFLLSENEFLEHSLLPFIGSVPRKDY